MRRAATVRTPKLRAHEALGLAIGRLAMADPAFHADFQRGFALAIKEDHLGRRPSDVSAAAAAALAAGAELHEVYGHLDSEDPERRYGRGRRGRRSR